ncbi:hypothetical protein MMC22_005601 [Lobaria immixta]|nr:hypothetical protein [Lobaria immixta]
MSVDSMEDIYVLRAAEPGVPPIPPLLPPPRKPKQDRKPKQKLGRTTRSFKVVYEAKGYHETQRFRVPSTESYGTFLDRMAQVSTPVAGSFITGRDTGFTKDDGSWKYSLVSKKLNIEQPGVELTSNIMYQAMISELVKAHSPWSWVNVWHDKQKEASLKRTKRKRTSSDVLTPVPDSPQLPLLQPLPGNPSRTLLGVENSEYAQGNNIDCEFQDKQKGASQKRTKRKRTSSNVVTPDSPQLPLLQPLPGNPSRALLGVGNSEHAQENNIDYELQDKQKGASLKRTKRKRASADVLTPVPDSPQRPLLQPLTRNPSRASLRVRNSEHDEENLPLQPLPANPARTASAGAALAHPPALSRNPFRAVSAAAAVSEHSSRLPPILSPSVLGTAAAAATAAPASHPLNILPTYLYPPTIANPTFHRSVIQRPFFPPLAPTRTRILSPQLPHHPAPFTATRTPVQVIARRIDYAYRGFLVEWLEPELSESWESETWMREHGWGWVLDEFFRRGG